MPDVTIGICAYNADKTIAKAIESTLSQAFSGTFEIVVVDDGSTDMTASVVSEYAHHLPNVIRLIRTENCGIGAARNCVVQEARGNYLTWLDADDTMGHFRLARAYERTSRFNKRSRAPTMSYCDYTKNSERIEVETYLDEPLHPMLRGELCAYLWATMAPISLYRRLKGFNPELRRCEDQDFFLRFIKIGGKFVHVPGRPEVHYNFSTVGRSGPEVEESFRYITSQFREDYEELPDRDEYKARRLWEISNFYESARDWESMWRCRGEALGISFTTVFPRLMSAISKEINSKIAGLEKRINNAR